MESYRRIIKYAMLCLTKVIRHLPKAAVHVMPGYKVIRRKQMKMIVNIPTSLYCNLDKIVGGSAASKRIIDCVKRGKTVEGLIAEIEDVKYIMNEIIKNQGRDDLINFVNGLNQCLIIIDQYCKENANE